MSNQQLENKHQEEADRKLANTLGISYEEIQELEYQIHENTSEDGLVYGLHVEFNKDIAPEILNKVKGFDKYYTVYL